MPRKLHTRLAAALLVLLLATGALSIGSTLVTTRLHRLEAEQRLNLDLAAHIVAMKHDQLVADDGTIDHEGLTELFNWLMAVNPRLECYLLDDVGRVTAHDPSLGELAAESVSLEPIGRLLAGAERLPLLGDDPRSGGRKIFTAARLTSAGPNGGFLYVVLDSRESGSVVDRFRRSSILRLSIGSALVFFALAGVACILLFYRLTQPLRQLAERMRRSSGSDREPHESCRAAGIDEVAVLESTFDDLTRRLHAQIAQIERIEAARRELVAAVSHDLRTPLTALRGYLDTLILKNGELSPERRSEYLAIALRHSERLSKLVGDLFELSKLESHEIELRREAFSITELVQDNVQRYQIQAASRGVRLEAELRPGQPRVVADLGLIERVLENLLENALRFTPEQGLVTVKLDPDTPNGRVVVRVADTGCGIPEAEQKHVFERYYKATTDSRMEGGSGLGLAITKRILDLHDCEITLESAPGSGTAFSFALPMAHVGAP